MAISAPSDNEPLKVVLCWHMHQPEYRTAPGGEYLEPWTYLHAIKDYADMAGHLEVRPEARAVVNFSPVLLEQIESYARQLSAACEGGTPVRDPVLRALQDPPRPTAPEDARSLLNACMRAHPQRMIARYPAFQRLHSLGHRCLAEHNYEYLNERFYTDLAVWYHLAWMGETIRRQDFRIRQLEEKATGFGPQDRATLIQIIREIVCDVVPRFRRLAQSGQIELSVTPYAHPIMPLLIDWSSALEAEPDTALPRGNGYPGGTERVRWHLAEALKVFKHHFGALPVGCWPSEGGLSTATISLLEEAGFAWTATGQGVLRNSLPANAGDDWFHRPLRVEGSKLVCFFRDDGLSDRIGFEYATWHADDAVADLKHHLRNIATTLTGGHRVVSIIMDGENAWESYPENAWHFLDGLYDSLATDPDIELTTFRQNLECVQAQYELPRLSAGSWVHGSFSTWIGEPQKNRGWELLVEAANAALGYLQRDDLTDRARARVEQQLAVCEGSDWCWWFGEYNSADSVQAFDAIYRAQLRALYRAMNMTPPRSLYSVFAHGYGAPEASGTMRRGP